MLLLIFVFLSSQLQKMSEIYPTPIPFSLTLRSGPQLASSFSFVVLPEAALQGSPGSLFPSPRLSRLTPCFFLQSPQQNVMLSTFLGFVLFLPFLFLNFCFPTKIMPRKKTSCACFLLFPHTFVCIICTSLFSIVCAKTD